MMAPGLPDIALKYAITNSTILALTLSIFLLSFALGPLFLAPLSEMYGRVWVCPTLSSNISLHSHQVLHISNLVSLSFNLGCALAPNTGSFIVFRFLSASSVHALHRTPAQAM